MYSRETKKVLIDVKKEKNTLNFHFVVVNAVISFSINEKKNLFNSKHLFLFFVNDSSEINQS